MSGLNPLTIILISNSILLISLILTQNESTKDSLIQNNSRTNPIEIVTGICISLEIFLLLIFSKITDF
jgi:hypothetical protein